MDEKIFRIKWAHFYNGSKLKHNRDINQRKPRTEKSPK